MNCGKDIHTLQNIRQIPVCFFPKHFSPYFLSMLLFQQRADFLEKRHVKRLHQGATICALQPSPPDGMFFLDMLTQKQKLNLGPSFSLTCLFSSHTQHKHLRLFSSAIRERCMDVNVLGFISKEIHNYCQNHVE